MVRFSANIQNQSLALSFKALLLATELMRSALKHHTRSQGEYHHPPGVADEALKQAPQSGLLPAYMRGTTMPCCFMYLPLRSA